MSWHFIAPYGKIDYKPLVVARMLNESNYLFYDYVLNNSGNPVVKNGRPIVKNLLIASMLGQTKEFALTINLIAGSTGYIKTNLNGINITSANYYGLNYPTIFPVSNQ